MRTNTALTLYNRVPGTETYHRTVIGRVAWENRKASNVLASGGTIAADQAAIYLPARTPGYLSPKAWQALADKSTAWTLQTGDVVVKGTVTDEIHAAVVGPPAVAAFTMTDLKAKYDDVLTITSVDVMDNGSPAMRHFQIGAR